MGIQLFCRVAYAHPAKFPKLTPPTRFLENSGLERTVSFPRNLEKGMAMFRYSPMGSRLALAAVVASLLSAPASAWFQPLTFPSYGDADTPGDANSAVGERALFGSDAAPAPAAAPMVTRIAARFRRSGGRFGFARMGASDTGRFGTPVYGTGVAELNSPSRGIGLSEPGRTGAAGTGGWERNPPRPGGNHPIAHGPIFGSGGFGFLPIDMDPPSEMDPPTGMDLSSGMDSPPDPMRGPAIHWRRPRGRRKPQSPRVASMSIWRPASPTRWTPTPRRSIRSRQTCRRNCMSCRPSYARRLKVRAARTNSEVAKVVAQAVSEVHKRSRC